MGQTLCHHLCHNPCQTRKHKCPAASPLHLLRTVLTPSPCSLHWTLTSSSMAAACLLQDGMPCCSGSACWLCLVCAPKVGAQALSAESTRLTKGHRQITCMCGCAGIERRYPRHLDSSRYERSPSQLSLGASPPSSPGPFLSCTLYNVHVRHAYSCQ